MQREVEMAEIIELPQNFFGKEDREKLESFGGHEIAHGRVTRWHWSKDQDGDDVFEIFKGGPDEYLVARVSRDRDRHAYCAHDADEQHLVSGALDHVMAELDQWLASMHNETPA
jgi:hypothetical protein